MVLTGPVLALSPEAWIPGLAFCSLLYLLLVVLCIRLEEDRRGNPT
jgi:hypothetical protein